MAKVEIIQSLFEEIEAKFKREASEVYDLLESLRDNPHKGKALTNVGGFVIKEVKYKGFRFYFITDGYKLKFMSAEELTELLLRFVRMSDKKHQQKTIEEIKSVLRAIGPAGFK